MPAIRSNDAIFKGPPDIGAIFKVLFLDGRKIKRNSVEFSNVLVRCRIMVIKYVTYDSICDCFCLIFENLFIKI